MERQLESLTVEADTENIGVSYAYDMSGMRSSKTVVYGVGEAHTHEYTSAVTAPTCTTAGYTTYTCDCGESYVDNLVDALGHNYVQSGNVYTCSRCGDSYTGHEHSYTEATTEPTCLTAGYTVYTCSCGDSYTVEIPALGHNYVLVGQSGNVATYECSRCGHRYTAVIPVDPQPPVEYSLRSSNTVTEHHEYVYASGKLMRETITTTNGTNTTTQVLDFIYGSGSTPLALVYTNGTASPVTYYYVTNMQGDVVRLVNASGTVVARYEYDAWGRVVSATGSMAEVNPIRYRGYYYDAETELYYLQSRYYDPGVKRFINADGVTATGQGFLGCNMFAYCGNNPGNRADSSGYAWWGISSAAYSDQTRSYYAVNPSETTLKLKQSVEDLLNKDDYSADKWNAASSKERWAIMEQFLDECAAILGVVNPGLRLGINTENNTEVSGWNNKHGVVYVYEPYCHDRSILRSIAHELYHGYQHGVVAGTIDSDEPHATHVVWAAAIANYESDLNSMTTYSNNALEVWAYWFAGQPHPNEFDGSRWPGFS